jgi:PAS domain S-box-containing protein
MDTDRNLLFGALALQTGMIDSRQFAESCKRWSAQPQKSFQEVLVELGWLTTADTPHLEYLQQRALDKHQGDPKATLSALPSIIRRSLAVLEEFDMEGTVASSAAASGNVPPKAPAAAAAPEGRYAFLNLHAAGGIGRVWRARDRHLDREVAIKELRPEKAGNARVAARFLREARLTGQLEHPGIVPVYELASRADSKRPFYTMRFVHGRTLNDATEAYHAKRAKGEADPLEFVGLLTAFAAVCNTIAYAHSRGVLHRDLKGDNVVLGDFGEVIVLDWGLAKIIGQPDEPADSSHGGLDTLQPPTLTVQGEIMGTPAFMAPEQAEGRLDQIDQRTDIYGLGAMLYELLIGQSPFTGLTTLEVLSQVIRGNPVPPRTVCPEVPEALEAACLKAMSKEPERRFASATELAQEIQRWQEVQRRQAEEALRRQTEILRSILDGMSEGVFVADADGGLVLINPAGKRIIGVPAEATLDATQRTSAFYRPDMVTPVTAEELPSTRAIRGEEVDDAEMFIRPNHTGKGAWISSSARPLRDQSGGIRGAVVVFHDITERKRVESELRASEAQYRSLADLIPGIVWTSRPDGWIDYANRFWFEYTGLTQEQTLGTGWAVVLHPHDVERVSTLWAHSLERGEPIEVEYRVRRADGSYRWFLSQGRPVRGGGERIVKWFGLLTEIEDQKQGEKALVRQNALVRLLQQVTVAAYEATTFEEAMQAGLDQVCEYTGWPVGHAYVLASNGREELVPTTIWHLGRPEEFESFVRATETTPLAAGAGLPGRVLAGKEPQWIMDVTTDDNFPRAKAAEAIEVKGAFAFPVLSSARVVAVLEFFASEPREPDDMLLGAMAQIGLQLGQAFERKRTEQALRESERQFNSLANSIPQLAWMADATGHIFWYNQRWYDYTGTTLEEMQGWGWQKVHHPEEIGRVVERIKRAFATGEAWEDTFPLRRKDGEYRWFLSQALPIRDADGRVVRWFGTNTDVTERR